VRKPSASAALTALARHERLVSAGLVAVAVLAALHALRPATADAVEVVALARPVAAGTALAAPDLVSRSLPPDAVPDGAISTVADAVGLTVAGPMARGELLTRTRVLGQHLLAALGPDVRAVPVRVADPDAVALVREGVHVDLLAVPSNGGPAAVVGADLLVLSVPDGSSADSAVLGDGALVVVAASPAVAAGLAAAAVSSRISLVLRGG
jgi:Flp pilus assembly protein CpaB